MINVFMIIFLIVTIAIVALMISICITGTVFLLEKTGIFDISREIIKKGRK